MSAPRHNPPRRDAAQGGPDVIVSRHRAKADPAASDELTHELAGLLDGSLRHVHLAIDRLTRTHSGASLEHLEAAHNAMHQMAALLNQWRKTGASHVAPATETLSHAAQQAARLVLPHAQEKGVSLTIELSDIAAALPAGPMRRVLDNALRNSLEAIADDGDAQHDGEPARIAIAARIEEADLCLTVSDTGAGPSSDMFDEAGALRFGETTKTHGSGQGMMLIKRAADTLNGTVTLQHRAPRGALLELRCPMTSLVATEM